MKPGNTTMTFRLCVREEHLTVTTSYKVLKADMFLVNLIGGLKISILDQEVSSCSGLRVLGDSQRNGSGHFPKKYFEALSLTLP